MIITIDINMNASSRTDGASNSTLPIVYLMQNEGYVEKLECDLYGGSGIWAIPEDSTVLIRYKKYDGTGGEYDTLPDGSKAWQISGNRLFVTPAPQMLTVAGPVTVNVELQRGGTIIGTFAFLLNVKERCGGSGDSEDYYNIAGFLPLPDTATVGQYIRVCGVDDNGRPTAVEAVDGALESADYSGCYYRTVDGATEWLNPPMVAGAEYRTAERYDGKAVYRKLLIYTPSGTVGSTSTITDVEIAHGITNLEYCLSCIGRNNQNLIPNRSANYGGTLINKVNSEYIILRIDKDTWSGTFYFEMRYTKST